MITIRDFLVRGLLAGLVGGVLAFGVAYSVGEPSVDASISIEEAGAAAEIPCSTAPKHGRRATVRVGSDPLPHQAATTPP